MAKDDRSEALIAESLIGDEAEKFVKSELGQTILGMAGQEIEALHLEFETVCPSDYVKIGEMQEKIRKHRQFNSWLVELIEKGHQALEVWKHEQKN